jgi:hypothetical protein
MVRVVKMTDAGSQEQFDLIWMGFQIGASLLLRDKNGQAQTREERKRDLAVLRALKRVSMESANIAPETGDRARIITNEPLTLKQDELDRLLVCMERVPWTLAKLEEVEETLDSLNAADKTQEK